MTAQAQQRGNGYRGGDDRSGGPWDDSVIAQAGPDDLPGGMGGPGYGRRGMMGEMRQSRKHLDQLRMLKMLELLDLAPDQEVEFLTAFNRMRVAMQEMDDEQVAVLDSLGAGLGDGTLLDKDIYRLSDRVDEIKKARMKVIDDFVEKSRSLLTAEQYGKMMVFNERFDFEFLQQLRAFRGQTPPVSPSEDNASGR